MSHTTHHVAEAAVSGVRPLTCPEEPAQDARRGRGTSSPPQLGQLPAIVSVQAGQNVHS